MDNQLLAALNALYHNHDSQVNKEADKWLKQWQQTQEAWTTSDRLLHDPNNAFEVQYFCAQTLRTKVQRDFDELPLESAAQLRDRLISLICRFASGPPPVRTQLCLAVAALAAHLPASHWGEGGVIGWLARTLSTQSLEVALPCTLELLTVLPQEANSENVACRPERRRLFLQELTASAPNAFQVLASCVQQPGERVREQVLQAFGAWLRLTQARGMDAAQLVAHPLVAASLEGLKANATFDAAVDAVCELLWVTVMDPQGNSGEVPPTMLPLAQMLVREILQLQPRFSLASQRAREELEGRDPPDNDEFDDDEDTGKGIARLFAEMAEAYVGLLVEGGAGAQQPVQALLDVAAFPDYSICSMSFNFWNKLAHRLTGRFSRKADMDVVNEEQQKNKTIFAPFFEQLVLLIRGRVRYPENLAAGTSESRRDFKHQRREISELLRDVAAVLGPDRTLELLAQPLAQLTAGAGFDWKTAEAALYCISAVHFCPPAVGDANLLQLLQWLPTLPREFQPLQHTACSLVGAYANWIAVTLTQSPNPQLLTSILHMLVGALDLGADLPAAGSRALRDLCAVDGTHMAPCIVPLEQLYLQRVIVGGAFAQLAGALQSAPALSEDDAQTLMEAVWSAVGRCTPQESASTAVTRLLNPILEQLDLGLQRLPAPLPAPLSSHCPFLLPLFDRLALVFQTLKSSDLVAAVLKSAWPRLEGGLNAAGADGRSVERLCRTIRYGLKYGGKATSPMLPLMLDVLPKRYQQTSEPAFLFVVSELVKIFGDEPAHDAPLSAIVGALLIQSTVVLKTLDDFTNHPDLADDTYLLAGRVLNYCPRILFAQAELLNALIQCAMAGLFIAHRDAGSSLLSFFIRLLDPAILQRCVPEARQVLAHQFQPVAPMFVQLLFGGIAGAMPSGRIALVSDVLAMSLKAGSEVALTWMAEALAKLPDVSVAPEDKQTFMRVAQKFVQDGYAANDNEFERAVYEISDLCLRNRRLSQAAQAALLPPDLYALVAP